jgi:two-component system, chemotaxis family, chemotaxis protein CheY
MSEKKTAADLKIVVVDDSDFSRTIINGMLKDAGFQVVGEANAAEAALQVIKEKKPDVVIADIVMPEISGIELTEKINQSFDNISVIVISSLSQEHVVLQAIGAGASDFIAKPIQKQQLIDSLNKIIQQINKDN